MADDGHLLVVENLAYRAGGRTIIDGLSLRIGTAGRTMLLGPNGAGKSVLLRLCHGLLQPSAGRIRWTPRNGRAVRQAMVFQRPVMLRRSAGANLVHALALSGMPRSERVDAARAALRRVGLEAAWKRPARVLSGGEQQRLALARAWALQPDVLLLDEPCASLDPGAAREVEEIVASIHASGTKIIMTTHNLGQARRMGDDIVFIADGRVVEQGPAASFFRSPATGRARSFIEGELPW